MANIFIKDGNGATIEIFTFESATSVKHNASVPIKSDGTEIFTVANRGYVDIQAALPAGTNHLGKVSVEGLSISGTQLVSVGGPVSVQAVQIAGRDTAGNARSPLMFTDGSLLVHVCNAAPGAAGGSSITVSVGGPVSVQAVPVAGTDGTNVRLLRTDSNGKLLVDTSANVSTNSPQGTQMVVVGGVDGTSHRVMFIDSSGRPRVMVSNTEIHVSISPTQGNIPVSVAPFTFNVPVSIAGTVNVSLGALANNLPVSVANTVNVSLNSGAVAGVGSDGNANLSGLVVRSFPLVFNRGSNTWDRLTGTSVGLAVLPVSIAPQTLNVHVCNAAPGAAGGSSITTSVGGAVSVQAVPIAVRDTGGDVRQPLANITGNLLVHVCNSLPAATANTQLVSIGGAVSTQAYPIAGSDGTDARLLRTTTNGTVLVHVCNAAPGAAGGGGPTVSVGGPVSVQAVPMAGSDGTNVRLLKTETDGTLKSSGWLARPSYSFTRPTDVVTYALGDVVANSTVAGTVVPLSWPVARVAGGSLSIRRAIIRKSGLSITNAAFRLHIFTTATGVSVSTGDNTVFTSVWSPASKYAGAIDFIVDKPGKDGSIGEGTPSTGNEINLLLTAGATSISGILEARGAYTPLSGETLTVQLEIIQD